MSEQANLVAVAAEVKRAEAAASLSAITFACELESMAAGAARTRLFQLAHRLGLSADATRMVLDEYELRAKLLHEAYLILRNLTAQQGGRSVMAGRGWQAAYDYMNVYKVFGGSNFLNSGNLPGADDLK